MLWIKNKGLNTQTDSIHAKLSSNFFFVRPSLFYGFRQFSKVADIFMKALEHIFGTTRRLKSTGFWPRSFCVCLWTLILSCINTRKQTLANRRRRSVLVNLDRGRKHRPNAVRSVHTTKVKIPPYRLTKLARSVNKMFIIWQKQEQFNLFHVISLYYLTFCL